MFCLHGVYTGLPSVLQPRPEAASRTQQVEEKKKNDRTWREFVIFITIAMILTGRTSTLRCKQSLGHYHKSTCLHFKIWLAFWVIMLVSGYTVLDVAFLCFRVLDITIVCQYLATDSWILLSCVSEFLTLQFYANNWLQSPGYCFPVLQSSWHYNIILISGYRVLDIAFLCLRFLDITILC